MIRMVVSDMDGTLLNNRSEISARNLAAIRLLEEKQIEFAIASGRDYDGVFSILHRYNVDCEAILGNGAQYVDKDGKLLLSCYLDKQLLKRITSIFADKGIHYMIFTTKGFFTGCDPAKTRGAFIERGIRRFGRHQEDYEAGGIYEKTPCNLLQKIDDFDAFINQKLEIIKIEAFSMQAHEISAIRKKLNDIPDISFLSSFDDNIEVTNVSAQKGYILEQAVKLKGFSRDEVMVLGDGLNDRSLFECFPSHAYAPENADEELRKMAYRIVSNHNLDGFAEAVEQMLAEMDFQKNEGMNIKNITMDK